MIMAGTPDSYVQRVLTRRSPIPGDIPSLCTLCAFATTLPCASHGHRPASHLHPCQPASAVASAVVEVTALQSDFKLLSAYVTDFRPIPTLSNGFELAALSLIIA